MDISQLVQWVMKAMAGKSGDGADAGVTGAVQTALKTLLTPQLSAEHQAQAARVENDTATPEDHAGLAGKLGELFSSQPDLMNQVSKMLGPVMGGEGGGAGGALGQLGGLLGGLFGK